MSDLYDPERDKEQRRLNALPFRMKIEDVFVVKGHGVIVVGIAETGTLAKGATIMIEGASEETTIVTTVTKIEQPFSHDPDLIAEPNAHYGLVLGQLSSKESIKPGMIVRQRGAKDIVLRKLTPEEAQRDAEETRLLTQPFRMPIEDVFYIKGRGVVVTGRVEAGTLYEGAAIVISRDDKTIYTHAVRFEVFGYLEQTQVGDNIGILLPQHISQAQLAAGMVVTAADETPTD